MQVEGPDQVTRSHPPTSAREGTRQGITCEHGSCYQRSRNPDDRIIPVQTYPADPVRVCGLQHCGPGCRDPDPCGLTPRADPREEGTRSGSAHWELRLLVAETAAGAVAAGPRLQELSAPPRHVPVGRSAGDSARSARSSGRSTGRSGARSRRPRGRGRSIGRRRSVARGRCISRGRRVVAGGRRVVASVRSRRRRVPWLSGGGRCRARAGRPEVARPTSGANR